MDDLGEEFGMKENSQFESVWGDTDYIMMQKG
jgi:hypothetical protein